MAVFVDVTTEVGLSGLVNGAAAWADVDDDGWPEPYVYGTLYKNEGGAFTMAASFAGGPGAFRSSGTLTEIAEGTLVADTSDDPRMPSATGKDEPERTRRQETIRLIRPRTRLTGAPLASLSSSRPRPPTSPSGWPAPRPTWWRQAAFAGRALERVRSAVSSRRMRKAPE